jgi:hypothetical protein
MGNVSLTFTNLFCCCPGINLGSFFINLSVSFSNLVCGALILTSTTFPFSSIKNCVLILDLLAFKPKNIP